MSNELMNNNVLIAPLLCWAVAQLCKVILFLIKERKLNLRYLVSGGGMPSSHSALVAGLATAIALVEGVGSVAFGISVVLAFIVMYDAATVRHSVGQQAAVLNRLLKEIQERRPFKVLGRELKELIGHSPMQVLAGGLLGIGIASLWITVAVR
ncbi:MAG: divergent PAP2 family protein [Chloroflexota bacterium]|nr:divergent PAP2 family protein [Chloroflexota bacterium]